MQCGLAVSVSPARSGNRPECSAVPGMAPHANASAGLFHNAYTVDSPAGPLSGNCGKKARNARTVAAHSDAGVYTRRVYRQQASPSYDLRTLRVDVRRFDLQHAPVAWHRAVHTRFITPARSARHPP